MAQPNAYIGSPLDRLEDPKLLTGTATFVADLNPAGLLFAAILRSPVAHAVIESIDTSAARAICAAPLLRVKPNSAPRA